MVDDFCTTGLTVEDLSMTAGSPVQGENKLLKGKESSSL